jgi:hypothetical protein
MSPAGIQRGTLEVFIYTWPRSLLALIYSAAVALGITILFVLDAHFIDWFALWVGSWALPIATAIGIYALAGLGIWQVLSVRLRRPRSRPSLVARPSGLTTPWSVEVPWSDIDRFLMGTGIPSRGPTFRFPCAVVSNIEKYRPRLPWWLRTYRAWEPANAFAVLPLSKVGWMVRRDGVDPRVHVSDQALIDELNNAHARMRNAEPAPTAARQ